MDAPEIRYTTTSDGVRIAYGIYAGSGPPLMVLPATGGIPMSMAHHIPGWDAYVEAICEGRTPVRLIDVDNGTLMVRGACGHCLHAEHAAGAAAGDA